MTNMETSEVILGLRPSADQVDRPQAFWEPTSQYLRSAGGDVVDDVRQRLTRLVQLYPSSAREEIIQRLNHVSESTHRGAVAEIAMFGRLRELPYEVICDPLVPGGTPDFGLVKDGSLRAVVEVTTLSEPLEPEVMKTVDALNQLDGGSLRVSVEYNGHPTESDTAELEVVPAVKEWLDNDPTGPLAVELPGVAYTLRAIEIEPEHSDERLVAVVIPPMREGSDFKAARTAVRKRITDKGNAYAGCGLPLAVVCSSYNFFASAMDIWHVVCGTRLDQVVFDVEAGTAREQTRHLPDGLWGFQTGALKNRHVSYAVLTGGLRIDSLDDREMWGALHPDPLQQWSEDALFADRNLLCSDDDDHYVVAWDDPP